MLAAVPFGLVDHFGKYEGGPDRVENLAAVKRAITRIGSAAVNVGDGFSGANLRRYSGGELISGAVDRDDLDLRIVVLELIEQRGLPVAADVEIQSPFFVGRCNGLFPIGFPVSVQVSRPENYCEQKQVEGGDADFHNLIFSKSMRQTASKNDLP